MIKSIKELFKSFFHELLTMGGLLAALEYIRFIGLFPSVPYPIIIGVLMVSLIYMLSSGLKIENWSFAFLVWIPISIVLANPDPLFQSWLRYLNFVLVYIVASPLLQNPKPIAFRQHAFKVFLSLSVLFSVASFFGFFLGINMMRIDNASSLDVIQNQAGSFGGFYTQSMVLGPMAAVSAIACYYYYMTRKEFIFAALGVMSAGACMFAASRAAFIAMIVAVVVTTYYLANNRAQFSKWAIRWSLILMITFPVWYGATYLMQQKSERLVEDTGMINSRMEKYQCRISEIEKKPICGVGFCAIDPQTGDNYDPSNGQIEPGTSWLAVPAQTGLIGLLIFLGLIINSWKNYSLWHNKERALSLGVLTMFLVHFCAEGYLLSAGGTLSFLVWITIGGYSKKDFALSRNRIHN